jgi:nucleoside-diphosphate-sugar epimerase
MVSLFILGATGFIGNALVLRIRQQLPELQVTALIRNAADARTLQGGSKSTCVENISL